MPDSEELSDWEQELLDSGAPPMEDPHVRAARSAVEADLVDVQSAVEAMKAAVKEAPPDLIKAPMPHPLHLVRFPVYDRKMRGFRIIERAMGNNELKATVKAFLDVLVNGGARFDNPVTLDATAEVLALASRQSELEFTIPQPFRCSLGTVHDTRLLLPLMDAPEYNVRSSQRGWAQSFVSSIDDCIRTYDREGYRGNANFRSGSMLVEAGTGDRNRDELRFMHSHAPFMAWSPAASQWLGVLPWSLQRRFVDDPDKRRLPAAKVPQLDRNMLAPSEIENRQAYTYD